LKNTGFIGNIGRIRAQRKRKIYWEKPEQNERKER